MTTSATNKNIRGLCERSHDISKEKGWLDGSARPLHLITNLFKSELMEAFEDWRSNKRLDEVYYEVKFKEDDGSTSTEVVSKQNIVEARKVEGKYGRGRDFVDAKPCGIPIELADFIIRIAQHCGTDNIDLEGAVIDLHGLVDARTVQSDFSKWVAWMGAVCSLLMMSEEYGDALELVLRRLLDGRKPTPELLYGLMFLSTFAFADAHNIDLWSAIDEKEAFNRTRPHRHGGKKA